MTYTAPVVRIVQVIPTAELATTAVEAVERWAPFARHPHIAAIRESFVSREVEDTAALFFVHDYYPAAFTLQAFHLQQDQASAVVHLTVITLPLYLPTGKTSSSFCCSFSLPAGKSFLL